jgi:hypothetical protein
VADALVYGHAPDFLAVLAPYQVGVNPLAREAPLSVQELTLASGTVGYTISSTTGVDVVLLRESTAGQTILIPGHDVYTDAEFVAFRLVGEPFAMMARGTFLEVDGSELLTSNDNVAWDSQ